MLFHLPVKSSKECIAITDMTDQSDIISAILAEWGDYSPLVEPEIFGTGDPGQIARNISEFCLTELGSAIARCLFYHVSQGFTMTWHIDVPLAPSLDEFWAFVNEYEAARGIAFTPAERTTISASGGYALAYSARCENCLDPGAKDFPVGSFREALA